ncbi:MAG: AAA family ATPase, partial [Chloroflexota bacterium]
MDGRARSLSRRGRRVPWRARGRGSLTEVRDATERLVAQVARVVIGKDRAVEQLFAALLVGGHVLLDDVPGVGKTTLARAVARSLDLDFHRIQCTPDLVPSDVTGVSIFDQRTA